MTESPTPRDPVIRRVRAVIVGLILILAGFVGLILPILPGWILIIAGVVVIAGAVPLLQRAVSRVLNSRPVRRIVDGFSSTETGRRMIARALRWTDLRRGLTPDVRTRLVRRLLHQARNDDDDGTSDRSD